MGDIKTLGTLKIIKGWGYLQEEAKVKKKPKKNTLLVTNER